MNDFIEKWKTDSKFKNKVQFGLYAIFIVLVTIFAATTRPQSNIEVEKDQNENTEMNQINIPEEYRYTINVDINGEQYQYIGSKEKKQETIKKISEEKTTEYIYENNKYFKSTKSITNIVDRNEVYDIIDYNYLNIETINKYLSVANNENGKYIIYIKDIILGSNNEEYITIQIDKNKTDIDYTSLLKLFDDSIESCNIEMIIIEE